MEVEHIHKMRYLYSIIPRLYWARYNEDPREDQYYRTAQAIQYGEGWNTWKIQRS